MGITVHPLDLGSATADSGFLVQGWNPGVPTEVVCLSYLILGSGTPVVVDASYRDAARMNLTPGPVFDEQTEVQNFASQLARYDLRPEDIGLFIATHLHRDHTGLMDELPNAQISVQRRELQFAAAPSVGNFDRVDISRLVGPLYDRIEFVEGDKELLPGVSVAWTGGHTPGHQIVYVELDSGVAIITGDLVNRKNPGFDFQLPPAAFTDMGEVMGALGRIKRDATHVLPMHDPNVWVEYPDGVIE